VVGRRHSARGPEVSSSGEVSVHHMRANSYDSGIGSCPRIIRVSPSDGDDRARLQRRNRGQGSEHDAISDISTRNTLCDNRSVPQVPPRVSDRTLALP